ncbi:MAG: BTAD domain-containing putative transcriptional regulator, partial [Chloroflexota bacterium]
MPSLTIKLFGPPQIAVDGEKVEIGRRKALAIFIYLAVTGTAQSRDGLASIFWPEATQAKARGGLRSAVWALNRTPLAQWLTLDNDLIAFHKMHGEVELDTLIFQERADRFLNELQIDGDGDRDPKQILAETAASYQADFLHGFALKDVSDFDQWHFFEADRLRQKLVELLDHLIDLHLEQKEFEAGIPFGARLVAVDPIHERGHQKLMQLYALAGKKMTALRHFQICREILFEELGISPSPETAALQKAIQAGTFVLNPPQGADKKQAAQSKLPERPGNIPAISNAFIGRKQEIARMKQVFNGNNSRLLTILGPGGIGKTRLALEFGAEQLATTAFADGVFFVSLAPLKEHENIGATVAEAIGLQLREGGSTAEEQLIDYFRRKHLLLILDNFEHLLDGATIVTSLIKASPRLHILATSRERLNLYDEQRYPLTGLSYSIGEGPESIETSDAAILFLERVKQSRPEFDSVQLDLQPVSEICRLVEGMPLALELAAAWADTLSFTEISAEIKASIDFLEADLRDLPGRHQSIRAVINSSWERLSEREQHIFSQLGVFRGGFTRAAAKA